MKHPSRKEEKNKKYSNTKDITCSAVQQNTNLTQFAVESFSISVSLAAMIQLITSLKLTLLTILPHSFIVSQRNKSVQISMENNNGEFLYSMDHVSIIMTSSLNKDWTRMECCAIGTIAIVVEWWDHSNSTILLTYRQATERGPQISSFWRRAYLSERKKIKDSYSLVQLHGVI